MNERGKSDARREGKTWSVPYYYPAGAFIVSGGVATGVMVKLTSKGFSQFRNMVGMVGAGAAAGYTFEMVEQAGENVVFLASGGADGHKGLDFEKLAWTTGLVGAFPLVGKAFGWLASKVKSTIAARLATGESNSLVHATTPEITGKTILGSWGKQVVSPSASSLTLAKASNWFVDQVAKIPDLVSNAPMAKEGMERAYRYLSELRNGAKASLQDPNLRKVLEARFQIPSLDSLTAKYKKEDGLSGDALYRRVIQDIKDIFKTHYPEQVGPCFVAGTPVHTDKGLVPIEQVKVGDLVLSQPEEGGERAYKRVTRTFVHDDAPIWVVKYMLIDGDVPWGHPNYMPKDKTLHHCYVTANHPFWVEGKGWTAVEKLRERQVFELANGMRAHVDLVWPVIRSVEPGFGRVCSNTYAEGQEVHIVDFRNGSNLWKYRWNRHEEAPVPYVEDIPDYDQSGFPGEPPEFLDPEAVFTTRVYNLEVEDFHTYYIGELGVWVHNKSAGLELVHPGSGARMPDSTPVFDSVVEIRRFIDNHPDYRDLAVLRSSSQTYLEKIWDGLKRSTDHYYLFEEYVAGRLKDPLTTVRYDPVLVFNNTKGGEKFIRADGYDRVWSWAQFARVEEMTDTKTGVIAALRDDLSKVKFVNNTLRRITEGLTQTSDQARRWIIEIRGYTNLKLAPEEQTISLQNLEGLIGDLRTNASYLEGEVAPTLRSDILRLYDEGRLVFRDVPQKAIPAHPVSNPLLAQIGGNSVTSELTDADLTLLVPFARQYWINAGASEAMLVDASVHIGELPAGMAGVTQGKQITLSANGAGWGWYVDPNPGESSEFAATAMPTNFVAAPDSPAAGKLDLLTVLIHELGHTLGLEHSVNAHDEMATTVTPGLRRLPDVDAGEMAAVGFATTVTTSTRTSYTLVSPGPQYDTAANPKLSNTEFAGGQGWSTAGDVRFQDGAATLIETAASQTRLNQVFIVGENDRFLSFTVADTVLDDADQAPDDAFEVALLDANTGASLLGGTGLTRNDAFLNLQADGTERKSQAVTSIRNADGSRTYLIDLAGIPAGTAVNLAFDLIGFGKGAAAASSHLTIRDLRIGVPQTKDDSATLAEDGVTTIAALANDLNAQQPGFAPIIVDAPVHGQITINADGTFSFAPEKDWHGEDHFSYKLSDGHVDSNLAIVSLTVTPVNDAPVAAHDAASVGEDGTIAFNGNLLGNDSDVDTGTVLTVAAPGDFAGNERVLSPIPHRQAQADGEPRQPMRAAAARRRDRGCPLALSDADASSIGIG